MDTATILVVEDDQDINHLLCKILTDGGYRCRSAYSGSEGLLWAERYEYDLVLLDLMMPGMTGEDLITQLRRQRTMPILVLSAKTAIQDRVNVLRLGADDFIPKPFDNTEVLARVEAQLRRSRRFSAPVQSGSILRLGVLMLDRDAHCVSVDGQDVALTAREFEILALMMAHPKKVFTRAQIYEQVWGEEYFGDDNTVNVHVSNLRAKLGKLGGGEHIKTVWGIGFKMEEEV